ncbi:MAG: hypothetical protein QXQ47_04635 [Candidatus Bathyarchaeia archaeon]
MKKVISLVATFMLFVSSFPLFMSNVKADQYTNFPWITYKHDFSRSGYTSSPVPQHPTILWKTGVEEYYYLSSTPSVAYGKIFIGGYAFDQSSGSLIWDSGVRNVYASPTVYMDVQAGEIYLTTDLFVV